MNIKKYTISVIDPKKCDTLSKLTDIDIIELVNELRYYPLTYRKQLGLDTDITFGPEIEFQNAEQILVKEAIEKLKLFNNGWDLKQDNTVCIKKEVNGKEIECGGEILSPILRDDSTSWKDLKLICETLKQLNAYCKGESGGHVHVGAHIITEKVSYLKNFLKLWTIYEHVIFKFVYGEFPVHRDGMSKYAKPIRARLYNLFPDYMRLYSFDKIKELFPPDKRVAVSFDKMTEDGYLKNNTLEFRCPNGTIDPIIWQNNINLFCKMLMICRSDKYNQDLIHRRLREDTLGYEVNLNSYDNIHIRDILEFCDFTFTNNLDKLYFINQSINNSDNSEIILSLKK